MLYHSEDLNDSMMLASFFTFTGGPRPTARLFQPLLQIVNEHTLVDYS
jgi:hypothetical protein